MEALVDHDVLSCIAVDVLDVQLGRRLVLAFITLKGEGADDELGVVGQARRRGPLHFARAGGPSVELVHGPKWRQVDSRRAIRRQVHLYAPSRVVVRVIASPKHLQVVQPPVCRYNGMRVLHNLKIEKGMTNAICHNPQSIRHAAVALTERGFHRHLFDCAVMLAMTPPLLKMALGPAAPYPHVVV